LRPRQRSDLRVHVVGADGEVGGFVHQVANAAQEAQIGIGVDRLALVGQMPRIDLGLQVGPLVQKCGAMRRQVGQQMGISLPKCVGRDAGARQRLGIDERE
jgi:hypothetical protein